MLCIPSIFNFVFTCNAAHGKHVVAFVLHIKGFLDMNIVKSLAEKISSINGKVKRAEVSLSAEL